MSTKSIYLYYLELEKLIIESLSVTPTNNKATLKVDNLLKHSGNVQHTIIKNNDDVAINTYNDGYNSTRTTCVTIDGDQIISEFNMKSFEQKKKKLEHIHIRGQIIIGKIVDELKDLIKKYPNKYQAELAKEAGLSKDILCDNNKVIATFLDLMIDQDIITKKETNNRVYFKIKNDKPYKYIPYNERLGFGSKLEALCGAKLRENECDFIQQVTFPDLGNGRYRIDFLAIIDEYELYIEVDGRQHFEWVKHFQKTEEDFKKQQKRDITVNKYFKDNDMDLLRIRYDENIGSVLEKKIFDIRNSQ